MPPPETVRPIVDLSTIKLDEVLPYLLKIGSIIVGVCVTCVTYVFRFLYTKLETQLTNLSEVVEHIEEEQESEKRRLDRIITQHEMIMKNPSKPCSLSVPIEENNKGEEDEKN